jgi:hypothetical protein
MKGMMRAKQLPRQTWVVGGIVAVLVLAIGILGWKYYELKKDPSAGSKAASAKVLKQVGKLYELPTDEEPTIAKIQDRNKLADQAFYSNARNGDYVLVYSKNKLAIIYREKTQRLVNVGPVNFVSGDQTSKPVVAVLNGSGSNDRLNDTLSTLGSMSSQLTASSQGDAKSSVPKTVVVDVSGQNSSVASAVAQKLGGSVGNLPSGETAPNGASIVVIIGQN